MKAILTRQNADGSYDEVGMNNRFCITTKSIRQARKKAASVANGRVVRVQLWSDERFYASDKPDRTIYIKLTGDKHA